MPARILFSMGLLCHLLPMKLCRAEVLLVKDGAPAAVLVLPNKSLPYDRLTAKYLASHLHQMSGAALPTVSERSLGKAGIEDGRIQPKDAKYQGKSFVLIGNTDLAKRLGLSADGLGPEGVRIRTGKNYLALLGDGRGVQHACVTLLEHLGTRYLWPGELGKVVPQRETIAVSGLNLVETPRLVRRNIRSLHYSRRVQVGLDFLGLSKKEFLNRQKEAFRTEAISPSWFGWQKMGGKLDVVFGHAFPDAWEKYGKEHPEWFALQPDGSRDQSRSRTRPRFCLSNRELAAQLARDCIAKIEANPGIKSFSIGLNDGGRTTFCTCKQCEALDDPNGPIVDIYKVGKHVSLSDRVAVFTNRVVSEVAKKYPNVLFGYYAYSYYNSPPIHTKLHPNVVITYVGFSYVNEEVRQQSLKDWKRWSEIAGKVVFRPNLLLGGRRQLVPLNYVHRMAADFRELARTGMFATDFDQCQHHWATQGLVYYVLARLHWDPEQEVDAIIGDYCRSGFGPAAGAVKEYFRKIESITDRIAREKLAVTEPYTPEVIAELRSLLGTATEAVKDQPKYLARVNFLRVGLDFGEIQAKAHALRRRALDGEKIDLKEGQALADRRYRMMVDIFRNHHLAVNVSILSWGDWAYWRVFKWKRPEVPSAEKE